LPRISSAVREGEGADDANVSERVSKAFGKAGAVTVRDPERGAQPSAALLGTSSMARTKGCDWKAYGRAGGASAYVEDAGSSTTGGGAGAGEPGKFG
jgi:hypothetical protein